MLNFVIARYKEDITWVQSYIGNKSAVNLFVYNKFHGEDLLPNVGHESHTYLHHIITHYDTMKTNPYDKTFFLQGCIKDHLLAYQCTTEAEFIEKMINACEQFAIPHQMGVYTAHFGFRIHSYNNALITPNRENLCFGDWFQKHIGMPFHNRIRWWTGALFCVDNWRITQHPKVFYERLIRELDKSLDPEEGHFMERSWFELFFPDRRPLFGIY